MNVPLTSRIDDRSEEGVFYAVASAQSPTRITEHGLVAAAFEHAPEEMLLEKIANFYQKEPISRGYELAKDILCSPWSHFFAYCPNCPRSDSDLIAISPDTSITFLDAFQLLDQGEMVVTLYQINIDQTTHKPGIIPERYQNLIPPGDPEDWDDNPLLQDSYAQIREIEQCEKYDVETKRDRCFIKYFIPREFIARVWVLDKSVFPRWLPRYLLESGSRSSHDWYSKAVLAGCSKKDYYHRLDLIGNNEDKVEEGEENEQGNMEDLFVKVAIDSSMDID